MIPSLAEIAGPLSPDDSFVSKTPANKLILPNTGVAEHTVAPMELWVVPEHGVQAVVPTVEL